MTFWKRITIAAAAMASSKTASATTDTVSTLVLSAVGSKTASAAGAGGVVVAAAAGMGLDWLPWAVGAAGSTVVYAYKPPSNRPKAIANGVISVFLGGVGGPASVDFASSFFGLPYLSNFQTVLLASGVLAVAWPWAAPIVFNGLVGMWDGFTKGVSARQSKGNE